MNGPPRHVNRETISMTSIRLLALAATAALTLGSAISAVQAQELRIGLSAEPSSIDPHYHNLSPNNMLSRQVFETLVGQDEKQALEPGLAESWKTLDDNTWEFKLRRGVKFFDGSEFTADDVLATFKRLPNVPRSPSSFAPFIAGRPSRRSTATQSASRPQRPPRWFRRACPPSASSPRPAPKPSPPRISTP
jgi:peptide/nickel transport system substrate-binding protein